MSNTSSVDRDRPLTRDEFRMIGLRVIQDIDGLTPNHTKHWSQDTDIQKLDRLRLQRLYLPDSLADIEDDLVLPSQAEMPRDAYNYTRWSMLKKDDSDGRKLIHWAGNTGPGILFLRTLYRDKDAPSDTVPHISSASLCIYLNAQGPIEEIKYIFFDNIANPQTRVLLTQIIPQWWNKPVKELLPFEYGTREYTEIMGSRIGRLVGHIILGGFTPGTRRIARINVYKPVIGVMSLRFDIEFISPSNPGDSPYSTAAETGTDPNSNALPESGSATPAPGAPYSSLIELDPAPGAPSAANTPGARTRSAATAPSIGSQRQVGTAVPPKATSESATGTMSNPALTIRGRNRPNTSVPRAPTSSSSLPSPATSRIGSRANSVLSAAAANPPISRRSPASTALADIAARTRTSRPPPNSNAASPNSGAAPPSSTAAANSPTPSRSPAAATLSALAGRMKVYRTAPPNSGADSSSSGGNRSNPNTRPPNRSPKR